jgi:hypothetical protein
MKERLGSGIRNTVFEYIALLVVKKCNGVGIEY